MDGEHKQIGAPVVMDHYLIRAVDDGDVLGKASLISKGEATVWVGSHRKPRQVLAKENGIYTSDGAVIPDDVLYALLKIKGWKVQRP
mgnify:CR=1 FL=1